MPGGTRHVLGAAAAVFFLALALPAGALANGRSKCNASACKVYIEPNLPSAGKQQQGPNGPNLNGGSSSHVPSKLSRVLAQAGKDKGPLTQVLTGSGPNTLEGRGGSGAPGILGAVLDLGGGPAALLATLLACGLALATHSRARDWWRRRATP